MAADPKIKNSAVGFCLRFRKQFQESMPLYEYECKKCHHRFERIVKYSDRPMKKCPDCGGPVEQTITAPAVQFKGSGWYVTDYAKKPSATASSSNGDSKSKDEAASKKESASKDESASKKEEKSSKASEKSKSETSSKKEKK
jgi:putative FmdB family regulatory protein